MASQGVPESTSTLLACGRFKQARELVLESLALNPADAPTIRALARLEFLAGDSGRAEHWLDRLAAVSPEDPAGIALRGLLRARAGDRTQGRQGSSPRLRRGRRTTPAWPCWWRSPIALGAPAATAVSAAERAVAVTPDHAEARSRHQSRDASQRVLSARMRDVQPPQLHSVPPLLQSPSDRPVVARPPVPIRISEELESQMIS